MGNISSCAPLNPELVYLYVFRFHGSLFSLVSINTKIFQNEHYTTSIPVYCSILHDISKNLDAFGPLQPGENCLLFQSTMAAASAM